MLLLPVKRRAPFFRSFRHSGSNFRCDVIECRNMQYSAHCLQCKDCFGCCGLVGKQYYIFNKPYSAEEYKRRVKQIVEDLKRSGVYGQFFPAYFAACSYDDSLAGFHWPLSPERQRSLGYRISERAGISPPIGMPASKLPDSTFEATEAICDETFWDENVSKPFKIRKADLIFCRENRVPLSNQYYLTRLKENFRMIFFNGELRPAVCAKSAEALMSSLHR